MTSLAGFPSSEAVPNRAADTAVRRLRNCSRKLLAAAVAVLFVAAQAFALPPQSSAAKDIVGDWDGTLRAGRNELHLVVHITRDSHGFLTATMDSIDEDAMGIPITEITFADSKLTFSADSIQGNYQGQANSDLTSISGSWAQAGNTLPLNLKRAAPAAKPDQKSDK